MAARDRGRRPLAATGKLREPPESLPDFNEETPKFCLHHLHEGFDVQALGQDGQAALAKTLQKLSASRWKELVTLPRHGQGTEFVPAAQIKAPIPAKFRSESRFMVFRYHGLLPMAGTRVRDVYHILWIEREFNDLYNHG